VPLFLYLDGDGFSSARTTLTQRHAVASRRRSSIRARPATRVRGMSRGSGRLGWAVITPTTVTLVRWATRG